MIKTKHLYRNKKITSRRCKKNRLLKDKDLLRRHQEVLKFILPYLSSNQDYRILDHGGREGAFGRLLLKAGFKKIFIIDISPKAINAARRTFKKRATIGNVEKLNYKSNFFDFINSSHVLEHTKYPEKVVADMLRVLKPNRYAHIEVPLETKTRRSVGHFTNFPAPKHLRRIIVANGGKVIKQKVIKKGKTRKWYRVILYKLGE